MDYAEVAQEALKILDDKGWCKFYLVNKWAVSFGHHHDKAYPEGAHCLAGGVNVAMTGQPYWTKRDDTRPVYEKLAAIILEQYPERVRRHREAAAVIPEFNNDDRTTEDDIRTVLEKLRTSDA